ncbi:hypothetical protein [Cryobacterium sp. AP23]
MNSHPDWVAKIFHTTFDGGSVHDQREKQEDLDAKRRKLPAMVTHKPIGRVQSGGQVVLAWPEDTLSENGTIVGFVMTKVNMAEAVEIHQISNSSDRNNPPPSGPQWVRGFSWLYLANTAVNLCIATDLAHSVGAVIGDFNERNILVSQSTTVTLIDCDSMQFRSADGKVHTCRVGRLEYTAPELLDANLRTIERQLTSDLFALAVHIYMLLLDGAHPFQSGAWERPGEKPKAAVLAKAGHWAGGPNSPLAPQPTAPSPKILPPEVQNLFERAFKTGAKTPDARPTATEWRVALQKMIKTL